MEFLQFFYLDRVKLTIENIAGVMRLGDKYNVPKCVEVCVQFLKDVLTVDNIFFGQNLAILYGQQKLIKFCEKLITLNTAEVFQTVGFLECDKQVLACILNMNILSCSEVDVFRACMAWVRANSKQGTLTKATVKKYLDDLYYEIRFASMTMQELCSLQAEYESVLGSDSATITNMIIQPEFHVEKFNQDARHAKWNSDAIDKYDRTLKSKSEPYFLEEKYTTTFSAGEPLLLGSFVCSKIKFYDSSYRDLTSALSVKVEIFEVRNLSDTNTNALLTMKAKLQSKDVNHILLPHPILIRPGFFYKISIGQFPDKHVYFSEELKTQVCLNEYLALMGSYYEYVEFHNCRTTENGKAFDLISCLNFNKVFVDERR